MALMNPAGKEGIVRYTHVDRLLCHKESDPISEEEFIACVMDWDKGETLRKDAVVTGVELAGGVMETTFDGEEFRASAFLGEHMDCDVDLNDPNETLRCYVRKVT